MAKRGKPSVWDKFDSGNPFYNNSKYIYFLTISPPPRQGSLTYHYNDDKYKIRMILSKCTNHYLIYPELSETGRLHYHGVIIITSWQRFFKTVKRDLEISLGFISIKRIRTFKEHLKALFYCSKNYSQMIGTNLTRFFYKRHKQTRRSHSRSLLDHGVLNLIPNFSPTR